MEELWRDRPLCQRLARQAAARAADLFSVESTVIARIRFYQNIIDRARKDHTRGKAGVRSASLSARRAEAFAECLAIVAGAAADIPAAAGTPGARLLIEMEKIDPAGARVHLYGAGRHTARLMTQRHLWESRKHRVIGLIDDHPRFTPGSTHLGLPVQSLRSAAASLDAGDHVILSTDAFEDQFWRQTENLRVKGVVVHRLYGSL
jgi:hypothetical protein